MSFTIGLIAGFLLGGVMFFWLGVFAAFELFTLRRKFALRTKGFRL